MYSRLNLKNFRCFRDTDISFRTKKGSVKPAILIYGNNGSGKTSLMHSFSFLHQTCIQIHYNNALGKRKSKQLPYNLEHEVKRHYLASASGTMELVYEIVLKKNIYIYELIFNDEYHLVSEALLKKEQQNYVVLFAADRYGFTMGKGTVQKQYYPMVEALYQRYFGEATLLSVFHYGQKQELFQIKKSLNTFINFVSLQHIDHAAHRHQDIFNIVENKKIEMESGIADAPTKVFITASELVMNSILRALFPNIDSIKYEFKKLRNNEYRYALNTYVKTPQGSVIATPEMLSSSYMKVLYLLHGMMDSYLGNTLIVDDVCDGFHGKTLYTLINSLFERGKGQIILSLNSNDIMNLIDPKAIYLCQIENRDVKIKSLTDIEPIRTNHNIRSRYESGIYGDSAIERIERPYIILNWYNKYVRKLNEILKRKNL